MKIMIQQQQPQPSPSSFFTAKEKKVLQGAAADDHGHHDDSNNTDAAELLSSLLSSFDEEEDGENQNSHFADGNVIRKQQLLDDHHDDGGEEDHSLLLQLSNDVDLSLYHDESRGTSNVDDIGNDTNSIMMIMGSSDTTSCEGSNNVDAINNKKEDVHEWNYCNDIDNNNDDDDSILSSFIIPLEIQVVNKKSDSANNMSQMIQEESTAPPLCTITDKKGRETTPHSSSVKEERDTTPGSTVIDREEDAIVSSSNMLQPHDRFIQNKHISQLCMTATNHHGDVHNSNGSLTASPTSVSNRRDLIRQVTSNYNDKWKFSQTDTSYKHIMKKQSKNYKHQTKPSVPSIRRLLRNISKSTQTGHALKQFYIHQRQEHHHSHHKMLIHKTACSRVALGYALMNHWKRHQDHKQVPVVVLAKQKHSNKYCKLSSSSSSQHADLKHYPTTVSFSSSSPSSVKYCTQSTQQLQSNNERICIPFL